MEPIEAIVKATDLMGGPAKAGRALNVSAQAVCFWRDGRRQLSAEKCMEIEMAIEAKVTCEEMRPDIAHRFAYMRSTLVRKAAPDQVQEAAA